MVESHWSFLLSWCAQCIHVVPCTAQFSSRHYAAVVCLIDCCCCMLQGVTCIPMPLMAVRHQLISLEQEVTCAHLPMRRGKMAASLRRCGKIWRLVLAPSFALVLAFSESPRTEGQQHVRQPHWGPTLPGPDAKVHTSFCHTTRPVHQCKVSGHARRGGCLIGGEALIALALLLRPMGMGIASGAPRLACQLGQHCPAKIKEGADQEARPRCFLVDRFLLLSRNTHSNHAALA